MKKSTVAGIMGAYLAMGMLSQDYYSQNEDNERYGEISKAANEYDRKQKDELMKIRSGLKKFVYGDVEIWALNKKNADRKARKQKLVV